jgi:peptidoglycan/LPS O-acetylase OafA/YrhL
MSISVGTPTKTTNWEALALVRFLLAFVVITGHLNDYADTRYLKFISNLGAFEAVLGFLLISGFSIGTSITKNKAHFFKRRLQRIYPVYLACIVFTIALKGAHLNFNWLYNISINLVFLNQIVTELSYIRPAWSLSLEVWLYCLAPLLLKLTKKQLLYFTCFSFACYIFYTCGRTLYDWRYFAGIPYGLNLLLLSFIWLAGFKLAAFSDKKQSRLLISLLLLGVMGLTAAIQIVYRIKNHDYSTIVTDLPALLGKTICLAIVYVAIVRNQQIPTFKPTWGKIANLLGNISYPLYLSHLTTFQLLKKLNVHSTGLYVLSALVVAAIIYFIFDFYSRKRFKKQAVTLAEN